jgi:predicted metal-binding membrane protein
MILSSRERARINIPILLVSVLSWMVLVVNPRSIMTLAHCPITDSGASSASFRMLLTMNPLSSLIAGWAVMLVAMMSPTLIAPIGHIVKRSFKHRRLWSVALFTLGYAAIWLAAGGVLLAVRLMLSLLVPLSFAPAIVVGIVVFVWQCSPFKQRCLNRNHNHRELAAFGFAADLDVLRFGVTHGLWCVGSCWALMLFPMLLPEGHLVAMALVTFLMISERLEQPRRLSWGLRLRGKLMRIVVAQTRIRLNGLLFRT